MEQKYFYNPYEDYKGQNIEIDDKKVKELIKTYVDTIITNTRDNHEDSQGDLYVGDSGKSIKTKSNR